jgi:hypothetical protein
MPRKISGRRSRKENPKAQLEVCSHPPSQNRTCPSLQRSEAMLINSTKR